MTSVFMKFCLQELERELEWELERQWCRNKLCNEVETVREVTYLFDRIH